MNRFVIVAHGEDFDVDAFLPSTPLRPTHVWRRGEQKRYACGESYHKTSGIEIELGDGRTLTTNEQQRIAAAFLDANRESLLALKRIPEATYFFLGLQFRKEIRREVVGTCFSISPRLMRVAAEIDIKVTVYLDLIRKDWFEETA
jgi:hypothetical protein